jgi:hypothetical protein
MENQPSHDELRRARSQQLRSELTRRALPQAYINRLVSELDDHLLDLLEERNPPMGAARKLQTESAGIQQRLGEPTQLAMFAAQQYHARTFWGRHPWLTYLVAPLPLLVGCWVAFGGAIWALVFGLNLLGTYLLGWTEETFQAADHLWLQAILLALFCWYAIVFPPLTAAWLLCRAYRHSALDWRWPLVGCALLAIVAGIFTTSYRLATEPGNGQLMFGFNLGASPAWFFFSFLPKFALALGIGLLLIKRAQQSLELDNTAPAPV